MLSRHILALLGCKWYRLVGLLAGLIFGAGAWAKGDCQLVLSRLAGDGEVRVREFRRTDFLIEAAFLKNNQILDIRVRKGQTEEQILEQLGRLERLVHHIRDWRQKGSRVEVGALTPEGFSILAIGQTRHSPLRTMRSHMAGADRLQFLFDERVPGEGSHDEQTVILHPELLGKTRALQIAVNHEVIHAGNWVNCFLRQIDCGKMISFSATGKHMLPNLGPVYEGWAGSDELEAYFLEEGGLDKPGARDQRYQYLKHWMQQLDWLKALERMFADGEMPNKFKFTIEVRGQRLTINFPQVSWITEKQRGDFVRAVLTERIAQLEEFKRVNGSADRW